MNNMFNRNMIEYLVKLIKRVTANNYKFDTGAI